jgi:hypothetical protein
MKKAILIMSILALGFILFLMSVSTNINDSVIAFINSIPFIGKFFTTFFEIVVSSWWHFVPLKPVFIFLATIIAVSLVLGINRVLSKLIIKKSRYTAAKKTMAHMVIKLDDLQIDRNSAMYKVVTKEMIEKEKAKEGVK